MNDSLFKTIVVDPQEKKNYKQFAKISEIAEGVEYIPLHLIIKANVECEQYYKSDGTGYYERKNKRTIK